MSERGPVDIPQHLKDSVPSASKYEEDLRRGHQIRTMAYEHGIPQVALQNLTVYRFVSVMRDIAAARRREQFPDPDRGSAAYRGLPQTEMLYRAAGAVLEEGFGGRRLDISPVGRVLQERLEDVGATYELVVPYREQRWLHRAPVAGMWAGAHDDAPRDDLGFPVSRRRPPAWWASQDNPLERTDREHLAALEAEAQRQGLSQGAWGNPDTHETLSRLVYARGLVRATTELDDLPAAPGLTPEVRDRLGLVAPLMKLAVVTLEEQFAPAGMTGADVITTLQPLVEALDRRVVPLRSEG